MTEEKVPVAEKKPFFQRVVRWMWRTTLRLLVLVLLLFVAFYLIIQIPAVQNWAAKKTTTYLSNELHTTVEIDYLRLEFFDKLVLDGFLVEDLNGDTLMYSQELKADINTNIFALLRRQLEVNELTLNDAYFHLQKDSMEVSNMQFLNDYFVGKPDTTFVEQEAKKPFFFEVHQIYLNDFHFRKTDAYKGENISFKSGEASIQIDTFNLPENRIAIGEVQVTNPSYRIDMYDWPSYLDEAITAEDAEPPLGSEMEGETPEMPDNTDYLDLTVRHLLLSGGKFQLHNYRNAPIKLTTEDRLDYDHLDVFDVNGEAKNFRYQNWTYTGELTHLSLQNSSGFILENLRAKEFDISEEAVILNDMKLITPNSSLGDTLVFRHEKFPDWNDFNNAVILDAKFNEASVLLADIMTFAPALENNLFFKNNRNEVIHIDGRIKGTINSLRGKNVTISLADRAFLKGDFKTRNLTVPGEQLANFSLERLETSMTTLRQIIPNFTPPDNFDKLGQFTFTGNFDGYFTNFVAYGKLYSELGIAEMDMKMELTGGREKARYSGGLDLINFDLKTWTDNPEMGFITFRSEVVGGKGLTRETAEAKLEAAIENFTFRGYQYDNMTIIGELKERFFKGNATINDDNIDFQFAGEINFTEETPVFDFQANVEKLALKPLRLSKDNLIFSGIMDLSLQNFKLSELKGDAQIKDFVIQRVGQDTFFLDEVNIVSKMDSLSINQSFSIQSEVADLNLFGDFDLAKIPPTFVQFMATNFPDYADKLSMQIDSTKALPDMDFVFDFNIKNSKNLTQIFAPKLDTLSNVIGKGKFNTKGEDAFDWDIEIPYLKFENNTLRDIITFGETIGNEGNINVSIASTAIGKNFDISPIDVLGIIQGDTVNVGMHIVSLSNVVDDMNLDVLLYPVGKQLQLGLETSSFIFLNDTWEIDEGNYIRFGDGQVEARNFVLTGPEKRQIRLQSPDGKGLEMSAENFDLSYIDHVWDYDRLDFNGGFKLFAGVENIFKMENIHVFAEADTFLINGDDWGLMRLDIEAKSLKDRFNAYLNMTNVQDGRQLLVEGFYNPGNMTLPNGKVGRGDLSQNYFNFSVNVAQFPLKTLEYFILNGISETRGRVDAEFTLKGTPDKPRMNGDAIVNDAAVKIDYLNVKYFVDKQVVHLGENLIDASGGTMTDIYGNEATVTGGITHDYLKNLGLDVHVTTDRLLGLNTTKEDNPTYYGVGIGEAKVDFTGNFRSTNIYVNATTQRGTELVVPVTYDQEASEVTFIKFKDKSKLEETIEKEVNNTVEGISFAMDLEVTEDADMKLIFDEQAGDIIQGSGTGNIQMIMSRGLGDINMFGEFEVSQGQYLFTLMNWVNKPFIVRPGGTINWSGDPFGAELDIVAEYKGLTASPANLIQQFLVGVDAELQTKANRPTNVDLTMQLEGDLLHPDIKFDIDFENVPPQLKTFTESALRLLRQDQNELNRQVFGLIVVGQFLPSDFSLQGQAIGINTVTEMLSQQLSIYLTEILSGFLKDDGLISDIQFDVGYSRYQQVDVTSGNVISPGNELELRLQNYLRNPRWSINAGANFDLNDTDRKGIDAGFFYAGNFSIEYRLSEDNQLSVRFYQSLEPEIGGGRQYQTGVGLSYRKEFNTFQEFVEGMENAVKHKR